MRETSKNIKRTRRNILNKGRVFVGLSGGVDSSVVAYLLKKEGYEVIGAFIKTWQPDFVECTWKEERRSAMRVAAHLDIPFLTIDLEREYKEGVADYMISEYRKGRTPNPDVMCNKEVKFGAFLKKALELKADFVATGHYAQTKDGKLFKAKDDAKEQSYFLWALKNHQLEKILFPIGHLKKDEVRKIAEKAGLHTFEKKDSQGICFIGKIDFKDFLKHYIPEKKGNVLDIEGNVIGEHDGAVFLTLGERRGFTITKKTDSDKPFYIVSKDIEKNTVTVAHEAVTKKFEKKEFEIEDANWISLPKKRKKYDAQVRYHQDYQKCEIKTEGTKTIVVFEKPQNAASGQSIVFYTKDECIGGGVIK